MTESWKSFVGREAELGRLLAAWQEARAGKPQMVLLLADSGYGKTRLLHEFYHRLAVAENRGVGQNYWPDVLSPDPTKIEVNPDFQGVAGGVGTLPWLWWGLRWPQPEGRNPDQSEKCAVLEWSGHLQRHVVPMLEARTRKEAGVEGLKSLLKLVSGLVPYGNLVVEGLDHLDKHLIPTLQAKNRQEARLKGVKALLDLVSRTVGAEEKHSTAVYQTAKSWFTGRKADAGPGPDKLQAKERTKVEEALDFVGAFLNPLVKDCQTVPVVLVLDDAQWADSVTLQFVQRLMHRALSSQWPLLVVITHWEKEWRERQGQEAPGYEAPVEEWRSLNQVVSFLRQYLSERVSEHYTAVEIGKLELDAVLSRAFPGLAEADRTFILNRCDGNALALEEFVRILEESTHWFEAEELSKGIAGEWRQEFRACTTDADKRAATRIAHLAKTDKELLEVLQLGACQGMLFFEDLISDTAAQLSRTLAVPEGCAKAEDPFCLVSRSQQTLAKGEFRHRLYWEKVAKRLTAPEREAMAVALREVLLRWWTDGKITKSPEKDALCVLAISHLEQAEQAGKLNKATCLILAGLCEAHAVAFHKQGWYEKAEKWQRKTLDIRRKWLPAQAATVLSAMSNLGHILDDRGNYSAAEPLLRQLLEARHRILGPEHQHTLSSVDDLGDLLWGKGDSAGAEALYRQALAGNERVLGPEHLNTLRSVGNLGNVLGEHGLAGAEGLYRRALAGEEKVLGPDHPHTLISVNNLASVLKGKGDFAGAEALYRRALAGMEKVLGPEHPDTLRSVNNLGNLLRVKGDFARAEPLIRRALEGRKKVLGPEHADTLSSVHNLGILLRDKGDLVGAEALYRRAMAGRETVLGPEHPATLISVKSLATLLWKMDDLPGAVALLRGVAGRSPRCLAGVRYNLSCFECLSGNVEESKRLIAEEIAAKPAACEQALKDDNLKAIHVFIQNLPHSDET